MRILNILCGIAVLFTTLGYAHILHHHFHHEPHEAFHNPVFWAVALATASAGILSFIGAILLFKRAR
ncbi:MAG: hypothetical protein WBL63_04360 [Candidatus Acidiferrum sp.]